MSTTRTRDFHRFLFRLLFSLNVRDSSSYDRITHTVATPVTLEPVPSIDPATGKVCANYPRTRPLDVPQLLARAREVQAQWAKLPVEQRCARISVLKKKILEARDVLTDAVVRESGKPRVEAKFADEDGRLDDVEL